MEDLFRYKIPHADFVSLVSDCQPRLHWVEFDAFYFGGRGPKLRQAQRVSHSGVGLPFHQLFGKVLLQICLEAR